jgi:hypothetical protein
MTARKTLATIAYDRLWKHSDAVHRLLSGLLKPVGSRLTHLNPEGEVLGEVPGVIYDFRTPRGLSVAVPNAAELMTEGYVLRLHKGRIDCWFLEQFFSDHPAVHGESHDSHALPRDFVLSSFAKLGPSYLTESKYHILTVHPILTHSLADDGRPIPKVIRDYFGSMEDITKAEAESGGMFEGKYLLGLKPAALDLAQKQDLAELISKQPSSELRGRFIMAHPERKETFLCLLSKPLDTREKKK